METSLSYIMLNLMHTPTLEIDSNCGLLALKRFRTFLNSAEAGMRKTFFHGFPFMSTQCDGVSAVTFFDKNF